MQFIHPSIHSIDIPPCSPLWVTKATNNTFFKNIIIARSSTRSSLWRHHGKWIQNAATRLGSGTRRNVLMPKHLKDLFTTMILPSHEDLQRRDFSRSQQKCGWLGPGTGPSLRWCHSSSISSPRRPTWHHFWFFGAMPRHSLQVSFQFSGCRCLSVFRSSVYIILFHFCYCCYALSAWD